MIKTVTRTLVAALVVAGVALPAAARAPWEAGAPRGMQKGHVQMAAQAKRAADQAGRFGAPLAQADWRGQGGRETKQPLSNMSVAALRRLFDGNYHVYQNPGSKRWSVRYFHPNGTTYTCDARGTGHFERVLTGRTVSSSRHGLAGMYHRTGASSYGWPTVADQSGWIYDYAYERGKWGQRVGFIQAEMPAVAVNSCPNMPRGRVNAAQSAGTTVQDLARGARIIPARGSFAQSGANPLTAGMYYYLYPPAGAR